jgi:hypothetical protein
MGRQLMVLHVAGPVTHRARPEDKTEEAVGK